MKSQSRVCNLIDCLCYLKCEKRLLVNVALVQSSFMI